MNQEKAQPVNQSSQSDRVPILAIDLGTSGCKTAIVDIGRGEAKSEVLAWAFQPVQTYIEDDAAEQNPEDWWQAILKTAKQVLDETQLHQQILAVSCSCQGENTLPIDDNDEPLMRSILWMDMRGAKYIQAQVGKGLSVGGYNPSKIYRWIKYTGGAPALTGKDPSGHMLYIKHEHPDIYAKTKTFLNVPDYLCLRLTGRAVASYDSILTSWVTDNRDPSNVQYHDGLIKQLGIDKSKFPEIAPCSRVIGHLQKSVADQLKLSQQVPVVAGAIDTTACALGAGTIDDNEAHLYIGTSNWLAAHVPYKKTDISKSIASVPCALPDKYLMIALQSTAGANLQFLRDNLFFNNDGLTDLAPDDVYQRFDQLAEGSPVGASGLLYTPWLYGERCPVEDKSLRATFINLSLDHTRADVIRAVMEGVALNNKWLLEPVNGFLSKPLTQIVLTGGGAMSDLWCQIFADCLNLVIKQPKNPLHTNALGAGFIAGVGIGEMTFADIPKKVEYAKVFNPIEANVKVYNEKYQTFLKLYKAMKPIYSQLNPVK